MQTPTPNTPKRTWLSRTQIEDAVRTSHGHFYQSTLFPFEREAAAKRQRVSIPHHVNVDIPLLMMPSSCSRLLAPVEAAALHFSANKGLPFSDASPSLYDAFTSAPFQQGPLALSTTMSGHVALHQPLIRSSSTIMNLYQELLLNNQELAPISALGIKEDHFYSSLLLHPSSSATSPVDKEFLLAQNCISTKSAKLEHLLMRERALPFLGRVGVVDLLAQPCILPAQPGATRTAFPLVSRPSAILPYHSSAPSVYPRAICQFQEVEILSRLPRICDLHDLVEQGISADSQRTAVGEHPTSVNASICIPSDYSFHYAPQHLKPAFSLPRTIALEEDRFKLSEIQVFLRCQIEVFAATDDDVSTHTRGRNKPISVGQVGIRCRHCAHLPVVQRIKGSTYFPSSLSGLYQAAQNMGTTHMLTGMCKDMPETVKREFNRLQSANTSSSGVGRPYWADSGKKLGLIDTECGIRYTGSTKPAAICVHRPG